MASVTFPSNIGGNGSTVTDDNNSTTGLGNGGHKTRFVPALAQVVAVADFMIPIAQNALMAPGTAATSTSSLSIGAGSKSLTLAQTGKAFAAGQWVQITSTASPQTQWMLGAITAFTPGTGAMIVEVIASSGSGSLSNWAVFPASPMAPNAGTYAPTCTPGSNCASVVHSGTVDGVQLGLARWTLVGNVVHVTGAVGVTPTLAADTRTQFLLTLPVNTTLSISTDLSGIGAAQSLSNTALAISGAVSPSRAFGSFYAASNAAQVWRYSYSYQVM